MFNHVHNPVPAIWRVRGGGGGRTVTVTCCVLYCRTTVLLSNTKNKKQSSIQRSRFFFASMLYRSTVSYLHIIIFPKQCMHCTVLYCKRTKGDKKRLLDYVLGERERERERKRERERDRDR
jgi:hypothetical protein